MIAQVIADDFISNQSTIWSHIKRLPPRHKALLSRAGLRSTLYWSPEKVKELKYKTQEEYVNHYRDLLFDEVRRYSRTQTALGSEVSGGLDSSAVFSVAVSLDRSNRLLAPQIQGYTLAFPFSETTSDLPYARAVRNHLDRSIVEVSPSRPPLEWYEGFARDRGTLPPRPNGTMEMDLFSAARQEGCRVILNGIGGDEWLGGSAYAASELLAKGDLRLLIGYMNSLRRAHGASAAIKELMQYGLYPLLPLWTRLGIRKARALAFRDTKELTVLSAALKSRLDELRRSYDPTLKRQDSEHRAPHQHAVNWPFLLWSKESAELLASLQGVELRSPLASRRMIEFSFAVAQARRRWSGENRWIHRRACEGIVAPEVLARRNKAEFSDVFLQHRSELTSRSDWRERATQANWVDPSGLEAVVERASSSPDIFASHRIMWNVFSCSSMRFVR
jgi:asparagine synthase (glutamine-hydrolysing)